jgi:hypothetical protein
VPALAASATSCSLAVARSAIRATRVRVPTLAGGERRVRADPALADRAACIGAVLAVSIASGGTAGDTAWVAFVRTGSSWRVLAARSGYKLVIVARGRELEVVQPVYRRGDPNCCPTGGFDRVRYRYDGTRLGISRAWHTTRFSLP